MVVNFVPIPKANPMPKMHPPNIPKVNPIEPQLPHLPKSPIGPIPGTRKNPLEQPYPISKKPGLDTLATHTSLTLKKAPLKDPEIVSEVVDNVCGALADLVLEQIDEPEETLVGTALAEQISELLNNQLQKKQARQSTSRALRGSCYGGVTSAGVEWIVHETVGLATNGQSQPNNQLSNLPIDNSKFFTTCNNQVLSCTANISKYSVDIIFDKTGLLQNRTLQQAQPSQIPQVPQQPPGLYRRGLPVELGTIDSSANSLYISSLGDGNNRIVFSTFILIIVYSYFFNIRR